MRRFAPLNAGAKDTPDNRAAGLYVTNIPALLAFADNVALWRSVDEAASHPLLDGGPIQAEWIKWQEAERAQDSCEQWLRAARPCVALPAGQPMTGDRIYAAYAEWCTANRATAFGSSQFWRLAAGYELQPWYPFGPKRKTRGVIVREWRPADQPTPVVSIVNDTSDDTAEPSRPRPQETMTQGGRGGPNAATLIDKINALARDAA